MTKDSPSQPEGMQIPWPAPLSPQMLAMFREFLAENGHPEECLDDVEGLEFVSEGFQVAVYPPNFEPTLLIMEVEAMKFGPGEIENDFARLCWLHQKNNSARLTDGWIATISPESGNLILSRRIRVHQTTAMEFSNTLADGINSAFRLCEEWKSFDPETLYGGYSSESSFFLRA